MSDETPKSFQIDPAIVLRRLVDLLQKRDPYTAGVESIHGCEHIALTLRDLIWAIHGEAQARRIFLELGWPIGANEDSARRIFQWLRELSASKQQYIADADLCFDIEMRGSARRLASDIAAKTGEDTETVRKRIERTKKRYRRMGGDIVKR